jgi:nucleoside-diphosphate-sugar epimerase
MKRVLLTGGTGFVGANLVRRLLRDGHELHLLVRPRHDAWRLAEVDRDLQRYEVELADAAAVTRVVARIRPEWVFHLAAYGAYPVQTDLARMVDTNLRGTIHLVQACLASGFEAFVNTGSSSEYGFKDHAPAETEWLEPNSDYAVTKAAATLYCRHTAISRDVPLRTLRLYSVYGPWEEPIRLVPTLVLSGLDGELPPLAHPDSARDYLYADDASEAYVLAASRPDQPAGAVYNVGTGVQTSLREAVDVARRLLGIAPAPVWGSMAPRRWDTAVWVADSRAIRAALGWAPRHDFADGFGRTIQWFRESPGMRNIYAARRSTPPSTARG